MTENAITIRWDQSDLVRDSLLSKSDMKLIVCCFAEPFSPISRGLAKCRFIEENLFLYRNDVIFC